MSTRRGGRLRLKSTDDVCDSFTLPTPCLASMGVDPGRPFGVVCLQDFIVGWIVIVNYEHGSNRRDEGLFDELDGNAHAPLNSAPRNEITKLAPGRGISLLVGAYLISCPPAVRFARHKYRPTPRPPCILRVKKRLKRLSKILRAQCPGRCLKPPPRSLQRRRITCFSPSRSLTPSQ